MQKTRREKALIGARLREAREQARVSYEDAAEAAGCQVSAVLSWERGSTLPTLVQLGPLLERLGASACRILFGTLPVDLSQEEAAELARTTFSPGLQVKVDVLLAVLGRTSATETA